MNTNFSFSFNEKSGLLSIKSKPSILPVFDTLKKSTQPLFALPFDLIRNNYKYCVNLGVFKDSMIEGARFSRDIATLERSMLGSMARSV